jgi:hypothetical protein
VEWGDLGSKIMVEEVADRCARMAVGRAEVPTLPCLLQPADTFRSLIILQQNQLNEFTACLSALFLGDIKYFHYFAR